jgi:hypothetical protein
VAQEMFIARQCLSKHSRLLVFWRCLSSGIPENTQKTTTFQKWIFFHPQVGGVRRLLSWVH